MSEAIADETSAEQLRSLHMLSGSECDAPRPIDGDPRFAAMLLDGASITAICAGGSSARALGNLAKVAGLLPAVTVDPCRCGLLYNPACDLYARW